MEFRKVGVLSLVLGLAAFAQGCGNDCDAAADDIIAKYEECGVDVASDGDGDGTTAECTDEAAALLTCTTACLTAAPCEAVAGSPDFDAMSDALVTYGECVTECSSGGGTGGGGGG